MGKLPKLPIEKKVAHNPKFQMLGKLGHDRWTAINSTTMTAGTTTLTVDDTSHLVPGHILKAVMATSEIMRVTAVPSATTVTVARGIGTVAAQTLPDNTPLVVVGRSSEEFSDLPVLKGVQVRDRFGYTQIFRHPFGVSRTLQKSALWGGSKREDLRKEATIEWKKQVEHAFKFSQASENLSGGPNGNPIRTTGSIYDYVGREAGRITSVTTTLTKAIWLTFARALFRYGSQRKVVFCAPLIIDALSYWKDNGLRFTSSEEFYGVRVAEFETGHGSMIIVRDVTLENSPVGTTTAGFGGMAMGVDIEDVAYRYLNDSDMALYENVIADGKDGWRDEILGECGLELNHPERHQIMDGVTAYTL